MKKLCTVALLISLYNATQAYAAPRLEDSSLNVLLKTKIYSASKKPEDGRKSPSAQYVITEEDLKQMGIRHLADALRTVPGLQVAKLSSNKWMVASRGFGEQFSNKLLVLIDGRPVYTTLFSGVVWNQQDIPIQDIKQIEVIRGPGATMWGSNAVNGVINVITKSAEENIGSTMSTTLGFTDNGNAQTILEATHGRHLKDGGSVRGTVKLRSDPSYGSVSGLNYDDEWQGRSANFRYDSKPNSNDSFSIQGRTFANDADETYIFPTLVAPFNERVQGIEKSKGGSVQTNWTHSLSQDESVSIKGYVDYFDWSYAESRARMINASAEAQYDFLLFDTWETLSSVSYKIASDHIDNGSYLIYDPDSYTAHFFDALFQTKIPLIEDELFLTTGSRAESNSYVNLALSPSVKLSYEPDPMVMLWSSWSRAHRIPSRGSYHLTTIVAGTPGGYVALVPNSNFDSEELDAYEVGVRVNPLEGLQLDTTAFYNAYDQLRTFEPIAPFGGIAVPRELNNSGEATIKGIELAATYQTTPDLRLSLGYSYHQLEFSAAPSVNDTAFLTSADKWPQSMWSARVSYNIFDSLTLNTSAYYSSDVSATGIDDYTKVDANLAWHALENTELILGVDNLLDDEHPEYSAPLYGEPSEVPRLVYITLKVSM